MQESIGPIRAVLIAQMLLACGGSGAPASSVASSAAGPLPAPSGSTTSPHWSYSGDEGPTHWGDLDPSFAACKTGGAQSPMDLPLAPARHQPAPARPRWDPVPLHLKNNGHAIQVDDTAPSSFVVDGTAYHLAQFHFHTPSEHTFGGRG